MLIRRLCVVLVFVLGLQGWAFAQPYVIDRFDTSLDLRKDGNLYVKESIEVTFNEARHGIFRFIPFKYDAGKYGVRQIELDGFSVTDANGNPEVTKVTVEGTNKKIRIGDADITLAPGTKKTYIISYHAYGVINWFDKEGGWEPTAQLYWNATGEEWDTSIEAATVHIQFPESPGGKGVRARAFVGRYGSRDNQVLEQVGKTEASELTHTKMILRSDTLDVTRTTPLNAHEGLTVVLAVPASLIAKPSTSQQIRSFILPNLGYAIPLVALVAMFTLWTLFGRDPKGGPMVVQYEPPEGLAASECGALIDERVDQRDHASAIIALAVKGYLIITPKESGLVFKRKGADLSLTEKPYADDLSDMELKLLNLLKGCLEPIDEVQLRTHVAPSISELSSTIFKSLIARGYYTARPDAVKATWIALGTIAVVLLAVLAAKLSPFGSLLPAIVGGVVGFVIVCIFGALMARRTHHGAKVRMLVAGFEEFIRRAQGDQLEWITKQDKPAALFEEYLPYAIAFGLTQEWAAAFQSMMLEMPGWYNAPYGMPFNALYFANDLTSINQSLSTAVSVPPRSEGASGGGSGFSSGGGFSGGGMGGGGGGSW